MSSKRKRPLTYEELVKCVEEMSDIEYLSDENLEIESNNQEENAKGRSLFGNIIF